MNRCLLKRRHRKMAFADWRFNVNRSRVRPSDRAPAAVLLALFGSLVAACGGTEDCSVTGTCPNTTPTATISAPAGETVDEGTSVTFTGSATDPEDGAIPGSSLLWTSSIDGAIGTGSTFAKSDLSLGTHNIVLSATDSDGATGVANAQVTVVQPANTPPSATITAPTSGGSSVMGSNVSFVGFATDAEDGSLTGASLVWTSDLDGQLDTGASFSTTTLSSGTHSIVLTATDSGSATGADTISYTITGGAPVVSITGPAAQGNGAPHTVFEGTGVTFTATASDPDDGPLTGSSLVWTSNVDGALGTGASLLAAGLSAGMHTVTLTATDSDLNETEATVLTIIKPADAAGFQIHIRLSEGISLSIGQQAAVNAAVSKLEAMITGDVPDLGIVSRAAGTCGGAATPAINETFDDLVIYLEFTEIDGPFGTLGSAGWCLARDGSFLPLLGGMRFDTVDLDFLEANGLLEEIMLHEMMHVLGFGITWDFLGLLKDPTDPANGGTLGNDTYFDGGMALAEFATIGGGTYTGGNVVPVENDTTAAAGYGPGNWDGHWREGVFDEEIMTTSAELGSNPLSSLTIASFADLGYTVDMGEAEPYSQSFSWIIGDQARQSVIDLSNDIWRGELHVVDPDGRSRRIR